MNGQFTAPINFDLDSWDEVNVTTRSGFPVITAQSLIGTSFNNILGHVWTDDDGTLGERGVDYVALIPSLVASIKKLKEENKNLQSRVAALEANEVIDNASDSALLTLISTLTQRVSTLEGSN